MAVLPQPWLRAAAEVASSSWRSSKPLDVEVALGLKRHKALGPDARGFVADVVAGMARRRRFVEAAAKHLPFQPTREALVCLYLVGCGDRTTADLPLDRAGRAAIAAAVAAARDEERALDVVRRAARASSLPDFVGAALVRRWGDDGVARAARALGERPPQTLRVNTLQASRDEVLDLLARDGVAARPTERSPVGVVLTERANVHATRAWREGLCEMQDEGSQLVALLVDAQPGQVVVDGCAGAGGKTLQLAAAMKNKGALHAFDKAAFRLDDLRARAKKAGVFVARVYAIERNDDDVVRRLHGTADAVLVDAPCSGTGVLRRAPDIGWRLTPADVARLVDEQRRILDAYAALPKPGGRLVYATCSLLAEEDEGVVDAFLADHPDYERVDAPAALRARGVAIDAAGPDLVLAPHLHGTDGFYAAVLRRRRA